MLAPPRDQFAGRLKSARLLALAVPLALLGGAMLSEYVGRLWPCEMCWWQRYPHAVAILLALGALASPLSAPRTRILTLLGQPEAASSEGANA